MTRGTHHLAPINTLRWLRVIGDTLFALGALALAYFVVGLKTGWSVRDDVDLPLS